MPVDLSHHLQGTEEKVLWKILTDHDLLTEAETIQDTQVTHLEDYLPLEMVTGGMPLKEEVVQPLLELHRGAHQLQVLQDDLLMEVHQELLASPLAQE